MKRLRTYRDISRIIVFSGIFSVILLFLSLLPPPDDTSDYSRVLFSRQGSILRVWLNKKEQYRLRQEQEISQKYKIAVLHFEDKRFNKHLGIDPLATTRAIKQNLQAGKIVSGASTITMQLARLKHPRKRTIFAKLTEAHLALRIELHYGKDEIFTQYAGLLPFGGNIVGLETASWRFFEQSAQTLTWSQAALLTLLPNRPSAINLEKERPLLLQRRNKLLISIAKAGFMDDETLNSALQEPLPQKSAQWRFKTPHFVEAAAARFPDETVMQAAIDDEVQERLERIATNYGEKIRKSSDVNVSVLIVETQSGKIRGYLGSLNYYDSLSKGMLDGVRARRSTGSVLKPFLYALAIERGPYTPQSLIEDIPTYYRGFSPQNAERNFSGIIPLKDALTNSLNVPAVRVLADYGVEDFHYYMKSAGLKGLFRIPQDYGLSLILGGGEASLLELVPLYSMLMNDGEKTPLQWLENSPQTRKREQLLQAVTAYHIREILNETKKPRQIAAAYKTGTSYGSRDAWALGVNAQWTIGVWVGNFAGGSVSGLSGANTASPLLFSLFESLDDNKLPQWRGLPSNADFETVEICNLSGYKAGDFCIDTKPLILPINRNINSKCSIHKRTIISKSNSFAVCSLCWDVDDTVSVIEEHYSPAVMAQLRKNGTLKSPPLAHNPHCRASRESTAPFNITYPQNAARLFLPSQDALNEMGFVATAAHTQKDAQLQWFLDAAFLGTTYNSHKMPIRTGKGEHRLGVQDTLGRYTEIKFTVNVK